MATPFPARDATVSGAIDGAFGELFTFSAMGTDPSGDVNLPMVPDAAKPLLTCTGVWEGTSDQNFPMARGSNPDDMASQRSISYPSVSVADNALTWLPTRGCICTRLFDGAVYSVERTAPDGFGRTLFVLSQRMRP